VRTTGRVPLQLAAKATTTTLTFPRLGVHRVPLPQAIWVIGNSDRQWFGIDLERARYFEVSSLRLSLWGASAQSVVSWDLARPWTAERGITGAGVPMWAMVPSLADLRSAGSGTALHFVIAGDYSRQLSPLAEELGGKTDGTLDDHPIRAGERLRLTDAAFRRLRLDARTPDDHAVLWSLVVRGAICTDKTDATVGHNLRLPVGANVTIALDATDFEVLAQ
jgi:hypothetical protein